MKSLIKGLALNYPVKVFATGFVVLLLLSLPLFWIRFACEASLLEIMPRGPRSVSISPSGLVPPELENDPNVVHHSSVHTGINTEAPLFLGGFDYFIARVPGGRRSNVYFFQSDEDCMYFDKELSQIVYHYIEKQKRPDGTTSRKDVELCIGPEGVSETADKTLGRFIDPVISGIYRGPEKLYELILYDKKLRCFSKIDFNKRTVIKGPKLKKGDPHKPIRIGRLMSKNYPPFLRYLNWQPPQIKIPDEDKNKRPSSWTKYKPIIPTVYGCDAGPYLLVLDKTGRIDLLDKKTLEFAGTAGRLPAPPTYFRSGGSVTPRDLLDYQVQPLALTTSFFENPDIVKQTFGDSSYSPERSPSRIDRKYLGMFAASLSRDGTAVALAVFDEKGGKVINSRLRLEKYEGRRTTYVESRYVEPRYVEPGYVEPSKAVFFGTPWSPTLTIGKFLAENLHSPILSLASYFTASAFEAAAGHRALFFLPNSFIAMKGRDYRGNFAERFFSALWLILPSIILAILLAWRVGKNAVALGLSENARHYWIIGTFAFGLTAYITYRLTRPKITLVTCQNCGKMRRPDMAKCHRCGSKWHVPELTPPAWRVLDGGE